MLNSQNPYDDWWLVMRALQTDMIECITSLHLRAVIIPFFLCHSRKISYNITVKCLWHCCMLLQHSRTILCIVMLCLWLGQTVKCVSWSDDMEILCNIKSKFVFKMWCRNSYNIDRLKVQLMSTFRGLVQSVISSMAIPTGP